MNARLLRTKPLRLALKLIKGWTQLINLLYLMFKDSKIRLKNLMLILISLRQQGHLETKVKNAIWLQELLLLNK